MVGEEPIKPCPHMKILLSALADDTLTGVMRWFTEQHARGCTRCGSAVVHLRELRTQLRTLNTSSPIAGELRLSEERLTAVEVAWNRIDSNPPAPAIEE